MPSVNMEEVWQSGIERADLLCAADATLAATRHTLLELERKAHATGWDGPNSRPQLFQLDIRRRARKGGLIHVEYLKEFTALIRVLMDQTDGNAAYAVKTLAKIMVEVRDAVDAPNSPWFTSLPAWAQENLRPLQERFARGEDLTDARPGYRFNGYALRSEAWMLSSVPDNADETWSTWVRPRKIHLHPERREIRFVAFVARDGLIWGVNRVRGERPFSYVFRAEDDQRHAGAIYHGLSIMVNGATSSVIPVVPEEYK